MIQENKSHKTAIKRKALSKPMKYLVEQDLIQGNTLDYGCGLGDDCKALDIVGYDLHHRPNRDVLLKDAYQTITCNYVLNVINEEKERQDTIDEIRSLLCWDGIAYISVRNDVSELNGWTKIDTWQGHILLDLPIVKKVSGAFIMYKVTKNVI